MTKAWIASLTRGKGQVVKAGENEGLGGIFTAAEMHLTAISLLNFPSRTSKCLKTCPNQNQDERKVFISKSKYFLRSQAKDIWIVSQKQSHEETSVNWIFFICHWFYLKITNELTREILQYLGKRNVSKNLSIWCLTAVSQIFSSTQYCIGICGLTQSF